MTDDSGRESREPARMTPERVRSLLEGTSPGPWDARGFSSVRRANGSLLADVNDGGSTAQTLADTRLIAAAPDIARAYLEACAERDAAYARGARGALDMRTRAAAVLEDYGDAHPAYEQYRAGWDERAETARAAIEALDVEVPQ